MSLSDKISKWDDIKVKDVKQFIKELKEALPFVAENADFNRKIDELAGEALI